MSAISKLTPVVGKTVRLVRKASPTILTVTGMAGVAGSLYLVWRAARKHEEVTELVEADLNEIIQTNPEAYLPEGAVANPDEVRVYKKKLTIGYLKAGCTYAKLYGPAVIAAGASLASIGAGFGILRRRNAACVAACAVAERTLARYRGNVVEMFGKDMDRKLRFGIKEEAVEVPVIDKNGEQKVDKEGNPKTKVEKYSVINRIPDGYSDYAIVFDASCKEFQRDDPEYNKATLRAKQAYFNELIQARAKAHGGVGWVFLNEVYAELGCKLTKAGQAVGWTYFDDPTKAVGDNYISFGVFDVYTHNDAREKAEFINGYRDSVILDFNVDGNILNYI